MARDSDGSLAPIPGALKRRLQAVDELNQVRRDGREKREGERPYCGKGMWKGRVWEGVRERGQRGGRRESTVQDLFPQCFFDEFDPLLDSADMCPGVDSHGT